MPNIMIGWMMVSHNNNIIIMVRVFCTYRMIDYTQVAYKKSESDQELKLPLDA